MARVRKSPNMRSTTGCIPVMAEPTPSPAMPASEMGESITRWVPNSSTSPDRTLKGVPASATSSPRMKTVESRRISSARASRMASPKVNSRSSINILRDFTGIGIGGVHGEFHARVHFLFHLGIDLVENGLVGQMLGQQPFGEDLEGIVFL